MYLKTVLFTENKLTNNPTVDSYKLEDGYFQHLFKSKNLLPKLPQFFPKKRLKGQHSSQDDGAKQLAGKQVAWGRWQTGCLFVWLGSVCIYLSSVCMCMYFSVLDKLTIHSIWISSCLGKTSSTMDNGISDIWIIFEFCFVEIAHVKFGRSSLLILVAPWRATCLMGLKSFCCRRHWQGLSLCETSAHAVISEITATAQNWMKLFSMFESCVELCAHSFTAQT